LIYQPGPDDYDIGVPGICFDSTESFEDYRFIAFQNLKEAIFVDDQITGNIISFVIRLRDFNNAA